MSNPSANRALTALGWKLYSGALWIFIIICAAVVSVFGSSSASQP